MARLTRQETRLLTRQKLIEAAEKEILRVGIFDASIRQICEAAGFTLGAFYSNFKNKDELLLEVVDIQTDREFDTLAKLVGKTTLGQKESALSEIAQWLKQLQKNKIISALSLEFEVYGNHNPSFKKSYAENQKRWHDKIAEALKSLFDRLGLTPRVPFPQMAVGLSALWSGFILEGRVPNADTADVIIPLFLEALLESSK